MLELPFVFVAGILGSAHCLGMCGPLALAIGARSADWRGNLLNQLCYTAGRVFTYSFLGACAGFAGVAVAGRGAGWTSGPALLAIVAGALLVYQGLATVGVIGSSIGWWRSRQPARQPCLAASMFRSLLVLAGRRGVFVAGLFAGFLPCGLVYAFLTLAASSASVPLGALTMAAFGLGTVPAMLLAGFGGSLLRLGWRQRVLQVAGWCVVIAGLMSVARGITYLPADGTGQPRCVFCAAAE
jgi:sulfite exporter TauE/SafE